MIFIPTSPGTATGSLHIQTTRGSADLPLSALAVMPPPAFSVSPSEYDFGSQYIGSTTTHDFTITNVGTVINTFHDPLVTGVNGGDFAIVNDGCRFATLLIGSSCTITMSFSPSAFGSRAAELEINSSDPNSPNVVALARIGSDRGSECGIWEY